MKFIITYLKNAPEHVPLLAQWMYDTWGHYNPTASLNKAMQKLNEHLNEDALPLAYIAIENGSPIGMVCLRTNDGIRSDLSPWLGSLFVKPSHRKKGVGEELIKTVVNKAKSMGYQNLYLLAFDPTLPNWYQKLGWKLIGNDSLFGHPVTVMELAL